MDSRCVGVGAWWRISPSITVLKPSPSAQALILLSHLFRSEVAAWPPILAGLNSIKFFLSSFFLLFLDGENPTQSLYQVGGKTQFITPNPNDCPGPLSTYLNLKGDSPLAEYPLRPRSSSCGPTNGTPPPRTTLRTIWDLHSTSWRVSSHPWNWFVCLLVEIKPKKLHLLVGGKTYIDAAIE